MNLRRMPLMDAASLQLEGRNMPMHVAALMTFEYPSSCTPTKRKRFISELIARWRQEPRVFYPWNQVLTRPTRWQLTPATREVYDLDLEYHLRHWSLPAPGDERELGQMIAWIHEQPMDLQQPLWECHFIDGLAGNRFALYVKIHHALVDGISGTRLVVQGLAADPDALSTPLWARELPADALQSAKAEWPTLGDLKAAAGAFVKLRRRSDQLTTFKSTPETILNGPLTAHRRVATQHIAMDRIKTLAKASGSTVNDVAMAMVGGALRDYLSQADALPEASLTAALPVSTRKSGDHSIGNQVSIMLGSLGTNVADPVERLEYIKAFTRAGKSLVQDLPKNAVLPYSLMTSGPFLAAVVMGRAGDSRPAFNTVLSNVPGEREARYLDGAKLLHVYPVSLIMPGVPLNFTCTSHGDFLNFGIVACRARVPRVQRLAVGLTTAFEALEKAVL